MRTDHETETHILYWDGKKKSQELLSSFRRNTYSSNLQILL